MGSIVINNEFWINDKKIKIISGAVHYYRIVPEYWEDTLLDLKEMGCNTVETYVPWNLHEPYQGSYDFLGIKNIEEFLLLANRLGLYVIIRASPYICAEWEMGGLPAWLLKYPRIRLRTSDEQYLKCVEQYFSVLLPRLSKYQITQSGSIILAQLENEYGSYGEDKDYLSALYSMMRKYGIEVPIFTADGTWMEALNAGSFLKENVFPTGNFGSMAKENIAVLKDFMKIHQINAPLMCMEFWDGWFSRWNQKIIKREPDEFVESAQEMMELGSINFYMFQGGTNFGWMNGCSARKEHDYPQITSYDYDAILTEYGTKTEKYHRLRMLITGKTERLPDRRQTKEYGKIIKNRSVSLFDTLETIAISQSSDWPLTMEELDHYYGYIIYHHKFKSFADNLRMRIIDGRDRAKIYLNNTEIATQYQEEIGDEVILPTKNNSDNDLKILIENMGRVNYGSKLEADSQRKGIRNGVILDIHFVKKWQHYCIDFNRLDLLAWQNGYQNGPGFHEYLLKIDEVKETFVDLEGFGKGVLFVNGHHCGRFYDVGPTLSLYVPGSFLKKGNNQIIIFETEGRYRDCIMLMDKPKFLSFE